MTFFQYASFAHEFTDTLWQWLLVGGLCFATVFVFQAIALFIIAKREGYKNKWMAFVPFFNTYYISVCAQKNRFYNIDTRKLGIATAVFELACCALYILFLVAEHVIMNSGEPYTEWEGLIFFRPEAVSANFKWAAWIYDYMYDFIIIPFNIVYSLLLISILICFFQTYACRRYVIFTITSIIFPIQGILFFVVSNNKGVNYKEFMRREQARQYQAYQQYYQQNPYNRNPYERNPYDSNPYNTPPSNNGNSQSSAHEDPFSDFNNSGSGGNSGSSSGGDPFDGFDVN